MENTKNKAFAFAIIMLLTVSIISMLTTMQITNAQSPSAKVPTFAFINVAPNPAGLGQTVTINFWIDIPTPTADGVYGDRWQNMQVKVVKPDGTNATLGPFTSDDTGGTYIEYTPALTGNYTFQMVFPGQTLAGNNPAPGPPNPYVGNYFQPSSSPIVTLTVQENAIPGLALNPLPTNYWTNPVQSTNSQWHNLTGNWLGLGQTSFGNTGLYNESSNYNPYTTAPSTPHILWTKPLAFGGLLGGEFGNSLSSNYYSTSQYEPKFAPIILNGILYYEQYPGASTDPAGWIAVDLRTGQTLWTYDSTQVLRCGQTLDFTTPNQYGATAYLWTTGTPSSDLQEITANINTPVGTVYITAPYTNGFTGTNYNMYDAFTGQFILSIVNGTAMSLTEDEHGDLIGYYVDDTNPSAPTLNMWNSTQAILYPNGQPSGFSNWLWRPAQNVVIPFSAGIMWSMPIATNISGVPIPPLGFSSTVLNIGYINSGVVTLAAVPATGLGYNYQAGSQIEAGYNANTGQQLWLVNRTYTSGSRLQLIGSGNGVYVYIELATATAHAYSLDTGAELWTTTIPNANPWDSDGGYMSVVAGGMLYIWGFGGDIVALNMLTGKILWQTSTTVLSGDSGSNTPYGVWPLWTFTVGTVADGILYIPEGHMYSPPLFKGAQQLAINITNGQLVWSILGFDVTTAPAISDGIMTTLNAYDNQIYGYGMGPSKTTVTAPNVGVTTATPITITGTVLDNSAGAQQQAVVANFPYGLPCVSDASMTQFMEAVYMQQSMPTNITGVPVTINVLDSNGNYRTIGTTTTTANGFYSFNWKPDIAGNYTVTAVFAGTQSYYGSSAQTAFYANAPSATQAPTATPLTGLASNNTLMYAVVAMIIVFIVGIAIVALLVTRKHP